MTYMLTFFEVMEIRELLSFKIASLTKSKLFFNNVKEQNRTDALKEDIELSIQEIDDLKNILIYSGI